jgi:hypothetical protein
MAGSVSGSSSFNTQYATSIGYQTHANNNGSVAIGTDSTGTGAVTVNTNDFVLGTQNHIIQILNNNTGSATPTLGANFPGTVTTAPYTWFQLRSQDGTLVWVPAWK